MRLVALVAVLVAAVMAGNGSAGAPPIRSTLVAGVDQGLCPFPLAVTVVRRSRSAQGTASALQFTFPGPSTVTLQNRSTGRVKTLDASGSYAVDTRTGSITFSGRQIWLWSTGKGVPFLSTDGSGSFDSSYVLHPGSTRARVIDPCALVAGSAPSTTPRATRARWSLPPYALSQIGHAGLTPLLGRLVRHDHVHLDVIVDGRKITVPAGVGMAQPVDDGPCSPTTVGDCATGHFFTAAVANSPLHTHSSSGLIHIETDRRATFTLGQFFDEWGVRFDARCLGGYCAGAGKELRVYVNGRRLSGDPRRLVLTNRQEIAVVFGGSGDFGSVPSVYKGGWPGLGCGGKGEFKC